MVNVLLAAASKFIAVLGAWFFLTQQPFSFLVGLMLVFASQVESRVATRERHVLREQGVLLISVSVCLGSEAIDTLLWYRFPA